MKGVAMTTETIIVLVLAVLVLVSLLAFFGGIWNPGKDSVFNTQQQSTYCTEYIKSDASCSNPGGVNNDELKNNILTLGSKLGFSSCDPAAPITPACIQDCCRMWCDKGSTTVP